MRLATNPLQCYALHDDGVVTTLDQDLDEVLRSVAESGFKSIATQVQQGQEPSQYQARLAHFGLSPAPGYFSASLSEPSDLGHVLESARLFALEHQGLGLTEACLADDLHHERVAKGPSRREPVSTAVLGAIVSAVNEIADLWYEFGITASVHHHVGTYIETVGEIDAVLEGTNESRVRLCPDTGHLMWADIDPASFVRRYRERVGVVHLKDARAPVIATGAALGWGYGQFVRAGLWAEPGLGDVDWDAVVSELLGFKGWLIVEVDQTPAASPSDSLRLCAEWAERVVTSP